MRTAKEEKAATTYKLKFELKLKLRLKQEQELKEAWLKKDWYGKVSRIPADHEVRQTAPHPGPVLNGTSVDL